MLSATVPYKIAYAQQYADSFSVDVIGKEIHIALNDRMGVELFKVVVLQNGGISKIAIAHTTYATSAGWSIWDEAYGSIVDGWGKLHPSKCDATAEPIIQEDNDYVSVKCFAEFPIRPLSTVTNITVCKTGVVFIFSTLKAEENALEISELSWGIWGLPCDIFAGHKAYVEAEELGAGTMIQAVNLPAVAAEATSCFTSGLPTYWMDFSRTMEGITVVDMDPNLCDEYRIWDQRGRAGDIPVFTADLAYKRYPNGAMKKDDVQEARVALYIHGPEGHEGNSEMINLLAGLGKAGGDARKYLGTFKDGGARNLASQALALTESAFRKIMESAVDGAKNDVDEASSLVKQAEDAETRAGMVRDLTYAAIPIMAIVILVIIVKMRRR